MNLPHNIHLEATDRQLTFTVTGVLLAAEIIQVAQTVYPSFYGRGILWNLSGADLSRVAPEEFAQVAIAVRDNTPKGVERRTAYVMANNAPPVAAWKYLNEVVRLRLPIEYQVFHDPAPAQKWLDA